MAEKVSPPADKSRLGRLWCLGLYVSLAGINGATHHYWIDQPAEKQRLEMHQRILANDAPAPIQYRIMIPYLAEGLRALGFSFKGSYVAIRFLFTSLSAVLLHLFLRRWFDQTVSLVGTLIFFGCLPLTQLYYWLQPTDLPNLAFTLVAFMLIRDRRDLLLAPLLAFAMLNRESPVLVPLAWLLYRWDELPLAQTAARFAAFCGIALGVYSGLRAYYGFHQYYSPGLLLGFNLSQAETYLNFILMLGVLIPFGLKGWRGKPKFMRRGLLFVPFLLAFNMIVVMFAEARSLLTLLPILIPAALASLWPAGKEGEPPIRAPRWLAASSAYLYASGFLLFIFLTYVYARNL